MRSLHIYVCVIYTYGIYKFLHVKVAVPFITRDSTTGAFPSFSTTFPLAANAVDGRTNSINEKDMSVIKS